MNSIRGRCLYLDWHLALTQIEIVKGAAWTFLTTWRMLLLEHVRFCFVFLWSNLTMRNKKYILIVCVSLFSRNKVQFLTVHANSATNLAGQRRKSPEAAFPGRIVFTKQLCIQKWTVKVSYMLSYQLKKQSSLVVRLC